MTNYYECTRVPAAVLEGIIAVKDTGALNMFDYFGVIRMADSLGYPQVGIWMAAHKKEYCQGIFNGFIIEESALEN